MGWLSVVTGVLTFDRTVIVIAAPTRRCDSDCGIGMNSIAGGYGTTGGVGGIRHWRWRQFAIRDGCFTGPAVAAHGLLIRVGVDVESNVGVVPDVGDASNSR